MDNFEFTTNWFELNGKKVWDSLLPQFNPSKILEIGSYEGESTCYLIKYLADKNGGELYCIDNWKGAIEQQARGIKMNEVENRFDSNTKLALSQNTKEIKFTKLKGESDFLLSKLITEKKFNYFDFIYVDGSHQAQDVLFDAIMAFKLLKVKGVIAFDDYLWFERNLPQGKDLNRCPKPAIDAFTNIFYNKINIIKAPLKQMYVTKISD